MNAPMADDFQPGDVVQLKSGGPKMTIDHTYTNAYNIRGAWCTWFDGDNPKGKWYPLTSLTKVQ
jgi:uncharacterized protein YodC (DUF2158 family)